MVADRYFKSVSLLVEFDGADGATTVADLSLFGHTLTFNGNAQLDTAQKKFGAASALFDGANDNIAIPASTAFDLWAGDATVELFARFPVVTSGGDLINIYQGDDTHKVSIFRSGANIGIWTNNGGAGSAKITGTTGSVLANTWHHVALIKSGSTFNVALDGVSQGTSMTTEFPSGSAQGVILGETPLGGADLNGWIDGLRITKGVARYTPPFTPPAAAFPIYSTVLAVAHRAQMARAA